jgi:ABC-type Fe3+/spermidine/putrescine transport system ATPase subunit
MADRIVVMNHGAIEQVGASQDIYRKPATAFVADFVGSFNALPVSVASGPGGAVVRVGEQSLALPGSARGAAVTDGRAFLLVRPEQLSVRRAVADADAPAAALRGRIADVDFAGPVVTLTVDVEGEPVRVLALSPTVLADASLAPGAEVWVSLPLAEVQLAPADGAAGR